jgi:hypothetical protein
MLTCYLTGLLFAGTSLPDPCQDDPCANIEHAMVASCITVDNWDFECRCQMLYLWNDDSNICILGPFTLHLRIQVLLLNRYLEV